MMWGINIILLQQNEISNENSYLSYRLRFASTIFNLPNYVSSKIRLILRTVKNFSKFNYFSFTAVDDSFYLSLKIHPFG